MYIYIYIIQRHTQMILIENGKNAFTRLYARDLRNTKKNLDSRIEMISNLSN